MEALLTLDRRRPLQAGLFAQLRSLVLAGTLRPGEALPSTRALAAQLGVGRNTVLHAYEQLIAEGFLAGRAGAGTFVHPDLPALAGPRAPASSPLQPRRSFRGLPAEPARPAAAQFDFQLGTPDPALFPWSDWRPLLARQLRARGRAPDYPPPEGEPRAREAIARHLGLSRAVRAGEGDVLVTSGAQQAFDLVARVLLEPGDCVAVEDPGYPRARQVFESLGARVVPVPVDEEGLVVCALPAAARLVYVTPSHQFPLGVPLSLPRRLALLRWSEQRNAAILEDDYDSEFRLGQSPAQPLQSLDRRGRVLYAGSFSKSLLPGLRLGFLVAPAALQPALRLAKRLADGFTPREPQRALADLLQSGLFLRHLRRAGRTYGERRSTLCAALERSLGAQIRLWPSIAGLHVSLHFRDPQVDAAAVAAQAAALGVRVQPLGPYYLGAAQPGLALGFGAIAQGRIEEGVERLAAAVRAAAPRRGKRRP